MSPDKVRNKEGKWTLYKPYSRLYSLYSLICASTLHPPCIHPASTCIHPASTLHPPCIHPASTLHAKIYARLKNKMCDFDEGNENVICINKNICAVKNEKGRCEKCMRGWKICPRRKNIRKIKIKWANLRKGNEKKICASEKWYAHLKIKKPGVKNGMRGGKICPRCENVRAIKKWKWRFSLGFWDNGRLYARYSRLYSLYSRLHGI